MMKRIRYIAGFICLVMSMKGTAHALVLAGWDVDGVDVNDGIGIESNAPPYAFHSTTSGAGHVEATLTLGQGVNPSTTANQYGFKIPGTDQTNSLEGAIASDHYLEFAINVDNGYLLNLSSIELVGQGTSGGCSNVVLMTSIDGFAAGQEIASAYPANQTGGFDTDASGFGGAIDLTASKYQNLTGTVRFRLYGWNSTSGSSPTYIRNLAGEDLVVFGEVVVAPGGGSPVLSMVHSNGVASIVVEFSGVPSTDYVLQCVDSLTNSNGWTTVSSPFSSATNWMFETTNNAEFYRAIAE